MSEQTQPDPIKQQITQFKSEIQLHANCLDLLKNYCRYGISDAQKAVEVYQWLNLKKQWYEEQLRNLKAEKKEDNEQAAN